MALTPTIQTIDGAATATTPAERGPSTVGGAYSPTPGTDPVWDAYLGAVTARTTMLRADADRQRAAAAANFDWSNQQLGETAATSQKNLRTSALSRGIYRSGVAGKKAGEVAAQFANQGTRLAGAYADQNQGIDASVASQLADIAVQQEVQRGQSLDRLRQQAADSRNLSLQEVSAGVPGADLGTNPATGAARTNDERLWAYNSQVDGSRQLPSLTAPDGHIYTDAELAYMRGSAGPAVPAPVATASAPTATRTSTAVVTPPPPPPVATPTATRTVNPIRPIRGYY